MVKCYIYSIMLMLREKIGLSILITFYLFSPSITNAQNHSSKPYKLYVELYNAPFASLYLHDYTEGRNVFIAGKKTKQFTWEIIIPDNIVKDFENMELVGFSSKYKCNSKELIRFKGEKNLVVNIGVEDRNNFIYGTFIDTVVFHNENFQTLINNKDTLLNGDLICSDFKLIIKGPNSDIEVRSQDPVFSWFWNSNDNTITYDAHLKSYIQLSKKYPNSRFLISNLAGNLYRYKSKEDIKKVFENFTDKHKNTIWAKHIKQFLSQKKFPNSTLPTIYEHINENIIQDTSKCNLVIFTASWCLPCIEEIPILKRIYGDLGKDLILTYISIDNAKGISSFKDLLKKQEVPWRSLLAYQDVKSIKQKYFIEGIPYTIFIYPNQNMETLDVRKAKDLSKLYSAISSSQKNP